MSDVARRPECWCWNTVDGELAMLQGEPPHNTPGNICFAAGYFAKSLERKYGVSVAELNRWRDSNGPNKGPGRSQGGS